MLLADYAAAAAAAAAKSLQLCPTLCDPINGSPPGSPHPWDSLGRNTGGGCHFLLQCIKVKSESEVAQSCLTLSDPMDCSLPGSSVHGIFQARVLEWGAIAFSMIMLEDIIKNPHGLCIPWNSPGQNTGAFPFSRGSSQTRDQTQISHIAGGFFTS